MLCSRKISMLLSMKQNRFKFLNRPCRQTLKTYTHQQHNQSPASTNTNKLPERLKQRLRCTDSIRNQLPSVCLIPYVCCVDWNSDARIVFDGIAMHSGRVFFSSAAELKSEIHETLNMTHYSRDASIKQRITRVKSINAESNVSLLKEGGTRRYHIQIVICVSFDSIRTKILSTDIFIRIICNVNIYLHAHWASQCNGRVKQSQLSGLSNL